MEKQQDLHSCLVVWRGQDFVVEMNPSATLKELGEKLQELTNVEADTLRLLVPMEKSSKLLYPFSDEHSCLSLESASVFKVPKLISIWFAWYPMHVLLNFRICLEIGFRFAIMKKN